MKLDYKKNVLGLLLCFPFISIAQVGINNTNPQAQLDITASNVATPSNTDGLLIPRVNNFPAINPTATQQGMLVYLTTTVGLNLPGFYFWDNTTTTWKTITQATTETDPQVSSTTSNRVPKWNGTTLIDGQVFDNGTNIGIGTTTPTDKVHVVGNMKIDGGRIPFINTGGSVFIGENAGLNDDLTNNQNVFIGIDAGKFNTNGNLNTFVGHAAGLNNTTGYHNSAVGQFALGNNTTGIFNTAIGRTALAGNTTGNNNTAIGRGALQVKTTGDSNTVIGEGAMIANTTGSNNVAIGNATGVANITGNNNTFIGQGAGYNNLGSGNVMLGRYAGNAELGSNKLYIDNSNTTNPLIYGDFATDILRVNGTLNINNAYNLPTTVGTVNQILQTNGAGVTSWVNPTTLSITETDPEVSSATNNIIPKWNGTTLVDGQVFDNGTNIGIGTISPTDKVHVVGNIKVDGGRIPFVNTGGSVFIGENAGQNDDLTNNNNVFIGKNTGQNATNISNNIAIGFNALNLNNANGDNVSIGSNAMAMATGLRNIGIGTSALRNVTGNENVSLGFLSSQNMTSGDYNTTIGNWSGQNITTGYSNTLMGHNSGYAITTGNQNTIIGKNAGRTLTTGNFNLFLGNYAGYLNVTGSTNVIVGNYSGQFNTGSGNVFLGNTAAQNETGSNKLYIDNSNTTTPLIYGDFATDVLKINGTLNINNAYNLPTNAGVVNQVLQTDGAGVTSWVNPSTLSISEIDPEVASTTMNYIPKWDGTTLVDGQVFDNGTNIGIGTISPTDKVHVVGNIKVDGGRIPFVNTGNSVFLGLNAGSNDDFTNGHNIGIGSNVLLTNVTGQNNTGIGRDALGLVTSSYNIGIGWLAGQQITGQQNVILGNYTGRYVNANNVIIGASAYSSAGSIGSSNTILGNFAGQNNNGSNNVFIGIQAGQHETGSNKLIIDNTNTTTPLIYGDFSTNLLRINGTLNVNNAYSLPTTTGTSSQILQTNGAGSTSWVDASTLSITETDPQVSSTTTNYIPKWNGTTLVDGLVFDNGTNIGIGTNLPSEKLHISSGNILADRGSSTGGITRKITIEGARGSAGSSFGQIDLNNFDGTTSTSYTGASIQSQNTESTEDGDLRFFTNNGTLTERMNITNNGFVGIGTSTPTQAMLVVNGSQSFTTPYGYLNNAGTTGTIGSSSNPYSIYASSRIAATEFNAFSDARIKNIKGITNNKQDLETLSKIEITNYTLKDSISKGKNNYKKVIAQQVENVYPQAVSKLTDVIPDIYKQSEIKNGYIALENNLKIGEKVKIISQNGEEIVEILEANTKGFKVEKISNGIVFVYGRQVSDFRSVDYEALSTLNISATQELLKQIEALNARVNTFENENAKLKAEIQTFSDLKSDIEMLKKEILNKKNSSIN